ncbi:MAG: hypothetical protein LUD27_01920 [Clostridia bacterium]|nr:hypothetical protein [Clostridia bacterium]
MTDLELKFEERIMLIRGALILNSDLTKKELTLYILHGKDAGCVKRAIERYNAGEYKCQR